MNPDRNLLEASSINITRLPPRFSFGALYPTLVMPPYYLLFTGPKPNLDPARRLLGIPRRASGVWGRIPAIGPGSAALCTPGTGNRIIPYLQAHPDITAVFATDDDLATDWEEALRSLHRMLGRVGRYAPSGHIEWSASARSSVGIHNAR